MVVKITKVHRTATTKVARDATATTAIKFRTTQGARNILDS
jgi:hypothetical protein